MSYAKATEEMVSVCREMLEAYHPHLDGVRLAIVKKDKASKHRGKVVGACVGKPSKKMKPLLEAEYHFVMVVAEDVWEELDGKQKRALMDHELCHCGFDSDGEAELRPHDLEEFAVVLARHGCWRGDEGETRVEQALLFHQGATVEAPEVG